MAEGATIAEHGRAIMTATADGRLTADQAQALLGKLERLAKLIKATDKKVQVGMAAPVERFVLEDPFAPSAPTPIYGFNYALTAPGKAD